MINQWLTKIAQKNHPDHPYFVLRQENDFEIRHYRDLLLVKTTVPGPFELALKNGKKLIHDYFEGNNYKQVRMNINSPLIMKSHFSGWEASYILPSDYSSLNVPRPVDGAIHFEELISSKVAVHQFNGRTEYSELIRRTDDLKTWAHKSRVNIASHFKIFMYHSKLDFAFSRKNEIHCELA